MSKERDGNGDSSPGGEVNVISSMADDLKALREGLATLTNNVGKLETKITDNMRQIIREETKGFQNEIEMLKGRLDQVESKLGQVAGHGRDRHFDIDNSVIVLNLAQHAEEDVAELCRGLFTDTLGVDVSVIRAERMVPRDPNKPGLVKCQLRSLDDKLQVLRNKKKVLEQDNTKRIFIARMKSHEERLIENNIKTILKEIPNGNRFRFTGSGRLVDNRNNADIDGPGPATTRGDEAGDGDVGQDHGAGWQTPRRAATTPRGESQERTATANRGRGTNNRGNRGGGNQSASASRRSTRSQEGRGARR